MPEPINFDIGTLTANDTKVLYVDACANRIDTDTKNVVVAYTNPRICIKLLSPNIENIKKDPIDLNDPNSVKKVKDSMHLG